jgi:hypothetical protein
MNQDHHKYETGRDYQPSDRRILHVLQIRNRKRLSTIRPQNTPRITNTKQEEIIHHPTVEYSHVLQIRNRKRLSAIRPQNTLTYYKYETGRDYQPSDRRILHVLQIRNRKRLSTIRPQNTLTYYKYETGRDYQPSDRRILSRISDQTRGLVDNLELKFFLRPTDSRPVRLGIGPPFGTLDQILSCSSFFC